MVAKEFFTGSSWKFAPKSEPHLNFDDFLGSHSLFVCQGVKTVKRN